MSILTLIITESIQAAYAIMTVILTRWLMELASPESDLRWLRRQSWYQALLRLRWYRGNEIVHQLRAIRLLGR